MARRHRIAARKTILAVNGFAGNRDLVARFCSEVSGAQYFGARGSTGEAVLWGEQIGAALGNIGAYQGYAAVSRSTRQPAVVDHNREGRHHRQRRGQAFRRRERGIFRLHAERHGAGRTVLRDLRSAHLRHHRRRRRVRRAGELRRREESRDTRGARGISQARCGCRRGDARRLQQGRARREAGRVRPARLRARAAYRHSSTSAAWCRGCFTRKAA